MKRREQPIFVLDVADRPTFAFAAEDFTEAPEFARAPWFARALGLFYANKWEGWDKTVPPRIRSATEEEASTYLDFANEFADVSERFFIAHLTELTDAR